MKNLNLIIAVFTVLCMSSCSKQIMQTTSINGLYTGTLEISNSDSASNAAPVKGHVNVNFTGMDYTSSTNLNYAYAGGSGKFFVRTDVITFTDTLMHPVGFDWNLVLNGSYTYSIVGDSITLVKKSGNKTYTYRLKKTKGTT